MENLMSWAALLLRVGSGLVMIVHGNAHGFPRVPGWEKNPGAARARLREASEKMGFLFPSLCTDAVAGAEFLGGVLLLLGLFTSWVAALLAAIMVIATYWLHKKAGFFLGSDFPFSVLFMLLALVFLGDGRFSLAALLGGQIP